jgi:uncharacterized protein DUF5709
MFVAQIIRTSGHAARAFLTEAATMPDERQHESSDLTDFQVLDSGDTLDGAPGDDPLDRGVVPPERWSAVMRADSSTDGQESLDQLLDEEEPDPALDDIADLEDDEDDEDKDEDDPDEADEDVDGLLLDDGPDPRAGRLIAPDGGHQVRWQDRLLAHDVGPDGGGATAEEAAMHVVDDDENDIRSE